MPSSHFCPLRNCRVRIAYPAGLIPEPEHAAALKQRTLTNLYNQHPAWLVHAHRALD